MVSISQIHSTNSKPYGFQGPKSSAKEIDPTASFKQRPPDSGSSKTIGVKLASEYNIGLYALLCDPDSSSQACCPCHRLEVQIDLHQFDREEKGQNIPREFLHLH
jgi:hypothetical protein